MTVFGKHLAPGETMHIIKQGDGACESCSIFEPGTEERPPVLQDLLEFDIRKKDPPYHEVFLVRLTTGAIAAVCCYCPWGARYGADAPRKEVARVAVRHIESLRFKCLPCELGARDEEMLDRHDLNVHGVGRPF